MFNARSNNKTVFVIHDDMISYLTLRSDNKGIFVENFDRAELNPDIVKKGEILQPDFLIKIIQKIAQKIGNKKVDVLIPHDYFIYEHIHDDEFSQKNFDKKVKEHLGDIDTYPWADTHVTRNHYYPDIDEYQVLVSAVSRDLFNSYEYVFKKSGLKMESLSSEYISIDHLVRDGRHSFVFFAKDITHVVDFKKNLYVSSKKFESSYSAYYKEVQKRLGVSIDESQKIIKRFGLLRAHRESAVYKALLKLMQPLVSFLKQRKVKESKPTIHPVYLEFPILGCDDVLAPFSTEKIQEFNIFKTPGYIFHDVLSLHKKDSYHYQPHIAQALKSFPKK